MRKKLTGVATALAVGVLGLQAGGAPAAATGGGVTVRGGPEADVRPGPDILRSAARSPLLENTGVWKAEPIMVSGTGAYRDGEFLYQDYLYDDRGADGARAYPDDPVYAGNAADLVEVRLRPVGSATAVRITYNSMLDPALVATTVALGDSPEPRPMPHGANTVAPAEVFVTVHGATGDIVDAATGRTLADGPDVSVDLERRQVDVRIPRSAFDPGGGTVRVAAAAGLWDTAEGRYAAPDTTTSAFFNVAFRTPDSGEWSDGRQAAALARGDISPFFARVDFARLRARADDDMPDRPGGVPQSGYMQRIVASHFETQQGRGPAPSGTCRQPCDRVPEFAGQLQPYSVYVPTTPPPAGGYGLVYYPHAKGANYRNSAVGGPDDTDLIGEELDAIVVFPHARGEAMWYWGQAAADVFEVAGDVMRRYPTDPARTYITGISMGGYGTYKLSAQWPDLFAGIAPIVGCTSAETGWAGPGTPSAGGEAAVVHPMAASWRNVPVFSQNGAADQACTASSQKALLKELEDLGYRYEWREYPGEHAVGYLATGILDPNARAAFLGGLRADRNPPHVTYVYNHRASQRKYGLNADHAYWVSGLALRDRGGEAPTGTIDVFSHGFGVGDPPPRTTRPVAGVGYTGLRKEWAAPPRTPVRDVLDITAANVSEVTIDVRRAAVSCDVRLNVVSDGPITVTLAGCPDPS